DGPLTFHAGESGDPFSEGPRGEYLLHDLGRRRRIAHQCLCGGESLVIDEILAVDVPTELGLIAPGLEHRQDEPTVVGGSVVADQRVRRRRVAGCAGLRWAAI